MKQRILSGPAAFYRQQGISATGAVPRRGQNRLGLDLRTRLRRLYAAWEEEHPAA